MIFLSRGVSDFLPPSSESPVWFLEDSLIYVRSGGFVKLPMLELFVCPALGLRLWCTCCEISNGNVPGPTDFLGGLLTVSTVAVGAGKWLFRLAFPASGATGGPITATLSADFED